MAMANMIISVPHILWGASVDYYQDNYGNHVTSMSHHRLSIYEMSTSVCCEASGWQFSLDMIDESTHNGLLKPLFFCYRWQLELHTKLGSACNWNSFAFQFCIRTFRNCAANKERVKLLSLSRRSANIPQLVCSFESGIEQWWLCNRRQHTESVLLCHWTGNLRNWALHTTLTFETIAS